MRRPDFLGDRIAFWLMSAISYSYPPNFSSNSSHITICCCNCFSGDRL
ncbi:hypothetical protein H6F98_17505 [Microcoleus sp. FACHB-SPT15]|nr:hypothetical protein [Microcoleus sp. FACHB-SPT15]MBD1807229.1 hypothetical protein [Microcoleus sp. FACHB-SPT15]